MIPRSGENHVTRAVIALGGNLGDRRANLDAAVAGLDAHPNIHLVAVSSYLETVAVHEDGPNDSAPSYLNAVVIVETTLSATALHSVMQSIENDLGRVRRERWGDRTVDLDLIDFDGQILSTVDLTLPHPRAHERTFVLDPWLEINGDAQLPGIGSVADARRVLS